MIARRMSRRALRRTRASLVAMSVIAVGGCLHAGTTTEPLPAGGRHVLFIGNSLTYANELPTTVAAIAASAGDTLRIKTVVGANLAVIDHVAGATDAIRVIQSEHWDYVVLQQGPTQAGLCRDTLVLAAKIFDSYVRASGGKTALFMTWPTSAGTPAFFDEVRTSYQLAAQAVTGVFLPAGEAWRAAWQVDPTLQFYDVDGYHPSALGSFVAALEIYGRLSGRDPRTLPAQAFSGARLLSVPEATIRILQQAAYTANNSFAATPTGVTDSRTSVISRTGC
jgi:hypothetical protein